MRFRCVLFDLDGTLVDSRDDIASSLDATLVRHGYGAVGAERVAGFVGDGARVLVERALHDAGGDLGETDAMLETYLDEYRHRHLDRTTLYPGVAETLDRLRDVGVRCGVVTNKPFEFTASLLEHLAVASHFDVVIGGDSTAERKPSPAPVRAAVEACGAVVESSAIVGDGDADMKAGVAAGVYTIGVTYGFRSSAELRAFGAAALIDTMLELPAVLGLPA